ncbi:MAG: thiamine phosphate synthase [Alphaproteobacteria bacterium]|nr:thiamine phosphate synthase [Alphaproteobacteria bacterium]
MTDCRLYLITPPEIHDINKFSDELLKVMDACDVAAFQLRLKNASDDDICAAVEKLLPLVTERQTALIMNDSPELALKTGCDGVHIGQADTPYKVAREMLGDDAMIGVTCHNSRHLAMQAGEKGADYVAFGAFYETQTKQPKARASTKILTWWQEIFTVPCVAIGGITPENCTPLIESGADFIAVSSGIWQHPKGAITAAQEFATKLNVKD